MLQGVYAFAGIVHFWDVQRHRETDPDDTLRAQVLYERWRLTIGPVIGTLLASGALTPDGIRLATALRDRERNRESAPVPAQAKEIAWEIALDNRLTWELRHTAVDLAGSRASRPPYNRGEPFAGVLRPDLAEGRDQGGRLHCQEPAAEHALRRSRGVSAAFRR